MCVIMDSDKKQIKLRANRDYYRKNRIRLCMRAIERYRNNHLIKGVVLYSVDHRDITVRFD